MKLAPYLPGSSSRHSPTPPRASASARPNHFEREGPNSTLTSRSIQTSLTNPAFIQSWMAPGELAAPGGLRWTQSLGSCGAHRSSEHGSTRAHLLLISHYLSLPSPGRKL